MLQWTPEPIGHSGMVACMSSSTPSRVSFLCDVYVDGAVVKLLALTIGDGETMRSGTIPHVDAIDVRGKV
jgi:hypothetical protein